MLSGRRKAAVIIGGIILLAVLVSATIFGRDDLPLLAKGDFENGRADGWLPKDAAHWRVVKKDDSTVYELTAAGEQGKIRAPTSWSLWTGHEVTSFVFTGRLQCYADPAIATRDMCILFHYRDPAHFYYVHFSASSDGAHNVISLVNGADRVKVNAEPVGTSVFRLTDKKWHAFKVTYDAATGDIRAYLDDMDRPILTARDKTLGRGLVGIGSFDDTGCFDDLELRGKK